MSRLSIETPGRCPKCLRWSHRDMERRIGASAYGLCPVDMSLNIRGCAMRRPVGNVCPPHWSGTVGGADRAGA